MDWLQGNSAEILRAMTVLAATQAVNVVGAIVVLIVGRLAAGWIRRLVAGGLRRAALDETLVPFLSGMTYFAVLAFTVVAVLGIFGVPTASFVAVLGAAGLAVGLALQGSLSNFAAGVMLLVFRPFRVGDVIEAAGTLGTVRQIGVFSTEVDTLNNIRVILPNSTIYGDKIANLSANELRRVDMLFGVSYQDDLGVARETIERIVRAHPRVLESPAPTVEVSALAESSVNFVVRPWCRTEDYWTVHFELHRHLKEGLESAGCSIPFPQRDVHLHQVA
ncbi:MAG: mechanosensitive ion channel [Gemmatimonadota bacterium]